MIEGGQPSGRERERKKSNKTIRDKLRISKLFISFSSSVHHLYFITRIQCFITHFPELIFKLLRLRTESRHYWWTRFVLLNHLLNGLYIWPVSSYQSLISSNERNALLELVFVVAQIAGIFGRLHIAHIRTLPADTAEWRSYDDLGKHKKNEVISN